MKRIRRSFGTGISVLLLLFFSVTVLPMDLFHSHVQERVECKDPQTNAPCKHSVHVSTKSSFCWVCAIHIDSSFTSINVFEKIASLPAIHLFLENEITGSLFELLLPALRGPPQN